MKKIIGVIVFIAVFSAGALHLSHVYTPQSHPDDARFYKGRVVSLNSQLEFKLDCCEQTLQLGLVTVADQSNENISKIETILKRDEMSCTAFDMGLDTVVIDTVYCSTNHGLISEMLLSEGLVVENCERSGNQFGTCT